MFFYFLLLEPANRKLIERGGGDIAERLPSNHGSNYHINVAVYQSYIMVFFGLLKSKLLDLHLIQLFSKILMIFSCSFKFK